MTDRQERGYRREDGAKAVRKMWVREESRGGGMDGAEAGAGRGETFFFLALTQGTASARRTK